MSHPSTAVGCSAAEMDGGLVGLGFSKHGLGLWLVDPSRWKLFASGVVIMSADQKGPDEGVQPTARAMSVPLGEYAEPRTVSSR